MSLRLKLTLTYSILLALLVTVFGAVLYSTLRRDLEQEMDRRLRVRASQVELTIFPGTSSLKLEDLASAKLDLAPLADLDAPGLYVQVLDRQGGVVATSADLQHVGLPAMPADIASALNGAPSLRTMSIGGDRSVRVLSQPITAEGKAVGILQVGQSRRPFIQTLADLRTLLLVLGGAILVAGGLLGWLVARRGLRPLERISRRAATITAARDFSQRLDMPRRRDEIGQLAGAIDGLLRTVDDLLRQHRDFVADISHELRNPLLAVRTNLELVGRVADEAGRQECVHEALTQIDRMSRLLSELVTLARAEAAQVIERRRVDLLALARETVRETALSVEDRTVRLAGDEAGASIEVVGDAERLRQVLVNLLRNACQHTPPGGSIEVSITREGDWACMAVADTGEGIAAKALPHIFDRFYQVHNSVNSTGGAGLGLAIVRHLVAAHGGYVSVNSQPGKGSRFTVKLPAGRPASPAPILVTAGASSQSR